ncbi:MAG: NAD(P)/FAD-dependent oxidoreductase [Pseudonocardiaceae bacterium]
MSGTPTFAIVGAGLAGATAAGALRAEGFDGRGVLLGAEPHRPYQRPPLSKDYLQGRADREKVFVHPPQWYAEHEIELRLATAVTALDRKAHELTLADGNRLRYDQLLLTTGAAPRRLRVPGSHLDGPRYLRNLDDSDRIKASLAASSRVVIIGAGWIGLETSAAARAAGTEVTVLERGELPLLGTLGPQVARVFADLHRDHGVDLRCKTTVTGIRPDGSRAGAVQLADGTELTAEVIIVGIGVTPNVELAQSGGLTVDNGILVDQHLRTSDPAITAAGDVANVYHPLLHRHIRVEHWATALHQPATAAATMLGRSASYDRLPSFFTDQYDLGMEYTGYTDPSGYDQVVIRGDLAARTTRVTATESQG